MSNQNLTILFGDMVGSTKLSMRLKRGEDLEIKARVADVVRTVTAEFGGRFVKSVGDGFLLTFQSPTDGVLAGIKVQEKLNSIADATGAPVRYRIGLHTGEVSVDDKGDIYGANANIASRIESAAEPGRIFISVSTYHAMNKAEAHAAFVGEKRLKGVDRPIGVYKILNPGEKAGAWTKRTWCACAVAFLACLGAGFYLSGGLQAPGTEVIVSIEQRWTNTGISVNPGATVSFVASGEVSVSTRKESLHKIVSPSGCSIAHEHMRPYPDLPAYSLIGRIGDNPPFFIGDTRRRTSQEKGEIILGINDMKTSDNSGTWKVGIKVN